jgi:lactoylglutathione lyase
MTKMKFGYTIMYVPNVPQSLHFFTSAFGLEQKFLHESGDYGELKTGETTLAFASHGLGELNFPHHGYVHASDSHDKPLGMEIALVTDDVPEAHRSALSHGATELSAPATKPWGQTVSFVRAPDGTLVELCTPIITTITTTTTTTTGGSSSE